MSKCLSFNDYSLKNDVLEIVGFAVLYSEQIKLSICFLWQPARLNTERIGI